MLSLLRSLGHGTETHGLVTYDTEPFNLANTTIPLTTLGEWCARIPARRLLIILDCCFSGGMGAKALQAEARPRDIQSVDAKLNRDQRYRADNSDRLRSNGEGLGSHSPRAQPADMAPA